LLTLLAACAQNTVDDVDYTRIAERVGGTIATPDAGGETGALADALAIACGHLPRGFVERSVYGIDSEVLGSHDGLRYTYLVRCEDVRAARMACSPATFRAVVLVEWQGRVAAWTLEHLQGPVASATGDGVLGHEAFLLDPTVPWPRHGRVALALDGVVGAVDFDGSPTARISLDDQAFALDLASGSITLGDSP
jgi:hypothetical protein